MTKRDERIEKMRRSPQTVRPNELDAVLIAAGFTSRQPGTSHKSYSHGRHHLVVPQRHPFLLPTYVKDALVALNAVLQESEDEV